MNADRPASFSRLDYVFKFSVVIALFIVAAIYARDIIIPLAFAGLISLVLVPIVRKLENKGLSPVLAISIVILFTVAVLVFVIWLTVNQIVSLVNDLPNLQAQFDTFLAGIRQSLFEDFGISLSKQTEMFSEAVKTASGYAGSLLLGTTSMLSTIIQIPIYTFLFLLYRPKFKAFFVSILPGKEQLTWTKEVERVIQAYISGLFLVTIIASFLNSVGLLIVGIDHAIFFGIVSGAMTIIPYIGITLGSILPILIALITKDSLWYPIGVIMVFATVSFLEGNFITPRITGSKVSINALAAFIALVAGGKILGIAGMILAIPALGVLKVILQYSPRLKHLNILLEDRPHDIPEAKPVVSEDAAQPSANPLAHQPPGLPID